jgi:hypothetical protein
LINTKSQQQFQAAIDLTRCGLETVTITSPAHIVIHCGAGNCCIDQYVLYPWFIICRSTRLHEVADILIRDLFKLWPCLLAYTRWWCMHSFVRALRDIFVKYPRDDQHLKSLHVHMLCSICNLSKCAIPVFTYLVGITGPAVDTGTPFVSPLPWMIHVCHAEHAH